VPYDVFAKAFAKLKEKHIGFAIESLALSWVGIPGKNAEIARKIRAAGGELAYVTLDEPLFNSRYYKGSGECNDDIQVVAQRASAIMREYQKVFPDVQIGDTEPFPAITKQPNWQAEYRQWLEAFKQTFGQPIEFLNVDINWPEDNWHWQQSLQQVAR
jgi:hypothetical protein